MTFLRLWKLETTDDAPGGYDTFDAFVVRAETEDEARGFIIAYRRGDDTWPIKAEHVVCSELSHGGEPEIILGSFNAG